MSLSQRLANLPRPLSRSLLYPLRYLNLMRALELRFMAPWARRVDGKRILDVGCGHGLYSLDLVRRGATLVGCDLDRPSLQNAQNAAVGLGLEAQTAFLTADGSALPDNVRRFHAALSGPKTLVWAEGEHTEFYDREPQVGLSANVAAAFFRTVMW